jgi:hypothetical protein
VRGCITSASASECIQTPSIGCNNSLLLEALAAAPTRTLEALYAIALGPRSCLVLRQDDGAFSLSSRRTKHKTAPTIRSWTKVLLIRAITRSASRQQTDVPSFTNRRAPPSQFQAPGLPTPTDNILVRTVPQVLLVSNGLSFGARRHPAAPSSFS